MPEEKVLNVVKAARESSKRRNFKQSFDLAINLKNIDLKRPESRIKTEVALPNPVDKRIKIGMFADMLIPQAKKYPEQLILIRKEEIEGYRKDKKAGRALANSCIGFVAEAPLMPEIAKALGPVLAVRGKMPKPIPPTIRDIKPILDKMRASVKIVVKDSPVLHCRIGTEEMDDSKVAENAEAVIDAVKAALPRGKEQIKNVYIKLTMGKPVRLET